MKDKKDLKKKNNDERKIKERERMMKYTKTKERSKEEGCWNRRKAKKRERNIIRDEKDRG